MTSSKPLSLRKWDLRNIRLPSRASAKSASGPNELGSLAKKVKKQPGVAGINVTNGPASQVDSGIDRQEDGVSQPSGENKISFMDLPGELRNRIYALAIPKEEDMPYLVIWPGLRSFSQTVLKPPIFRLNQQIRAEAISYKCVNQKFTFYNGLVMAQFLRWIGPSGLAALTSISLFGPEDGDNWVDAKVWKELLLKVEHLKHFQLLVRYEYVTLSRGECTQPPLKDRWEDFLELRKIVESIGARFTWRFSEDDLRGPALSNVDKCLGYGILGEDTFQS